MIYYIEHASPIGPLLVAATAKGLSGLYFESHKYFKGTDGWHHGEHYPHLRDAARQLDEYFSRRRTTFDLPLDMTGTEFQQAVWRNLTAIPFGLTTSYSRHAQQVGNPRAVRAVGSAIGRNPVSIIVPCHRVIGTTGGLSGYAGGLERKRYLLTLEGINLD